MENNKLHSESCFDERRQKSADRRNKCRRGDVVDRRLGLDRRRGPGKRLSDQRKGAEDGRLTNEQFEFLMAVDEYKKLNNRPFPTWTEVLEVVKAIGYRKVAEPCSIEELDKMSAAT